MPIKNKKLSAANSSDKTDEDGRKDLDAAFSAFRYFILAINEDRKLLFAQARQNPTQDWRRIKMRQHFEHIETFVYQIGRILLAAHKARRIQMSSADFSLLSGGQYRLSENGQPELRKDLIRSDISLLFTVRLCGDYCGSARTVNKRASDWKNYKIASRIFAGVTHPKEYWDYEITDDSYAIVWRALDWASNLILDLNNSVRTLSEKPEASIAD